MSNIIDLLKSNRIAFCLMPQEMQERAKEIGKKHFKYMDFFDASGWRSSTKDTFFVSTIYRLSKDYIEPEAVNKKLKADIKYLKAELLEKERYIYISKGDTE